MTVGIGLSLSIPLLSFALDAKGASRTLIGLNTAMPGVATLVCARSSPGGRAASAWRQRWRRDLLAAASLLAFNAVTPIWVWFPIRFALARSAQRAVRSVGILDQRRRPREAPRAGARHLCHGPVLGFALGPQVLGLVGTTDGHPISPVRRSCSSPVPIALAGGRAPPIEDKPSAGFLSFFWLVPSATLAALVFGAAETSAIALLPLYGTAIGLETASAIGLVSAFVLGNVLFQISHGDHRRPNGPPPGAALLRACPVSSAWEP